MSTKKDKQTLRWIGIIFVGAILLLVLGGNGGGSSPHGGSQSRSNSENLGELLSPVTTAFAAETNEGLAPNFGFEYEDGTEKELADFIGEKPVILDFWASWCHNCRRDLPMLNELYEKHDGQVEVIAVNLREGQKTVEKYLEEEGFSFITVLDPVGKVARPYNITYTNTHVLIDKEGKILDEFAGDINEQHFIDLIAVSE